MKWLVLLLVVACGDNSKGSLVTLTAEVEGVDCLVKDTGHVVIDGKIDRPPASIELVVDGGAPTVVLEAKVVDFRIRADLTNGPHDVVVCARDAAGASCTDPMPVMVGCACTDVMCTPPTGCLVATCDPVAGCHTFPRSSCATPNCALGMCADGDRDGDGLSDAWELAGAIDVDCNGVIDAEDIRLPNTDPDLTNVFLEIDYLEQDLPANPTACTDDSTCAADEQCMCRLVPDSCPTGSTCEPITRRCTPDATSGHFCTHTHKPKEATLAAIEAAFQPPGGGVPIGATAHRPILLTIDRKMDRIPERRVVSFGTRTITCTAAQCPGASCPCLPEQTCESNFCQDPRCSAAGTCPNGRACQPFEICPQLDPQCAGTDAYHFIDLEAVYFDARKRNAYHYAIAGHDATCPDAAHCASNRCLPDPETGVAPVAGTPGVAASNGTSSEFILASPSGGVLMHELGHNLNLRHGGFEDVPTQKPNHLSVMNELMRTGVPFATGTRLDYSNKALLLLDEGFLDETLGIGGTTGDVTRFRDATCAIVEVDASGPIDWDRDTVIDGILDNADIANPTCTGSPGQRLFGYREWPGQLCVTSMDCPICTSSFCPGGTDNIPLPLNLVPPTCPIGTTGGCHVPCVGGTCMPMEFNFSCR